MDTVSLDSLVRLLKEDAEKVSQKDRYIPIMTADYIDLMLTRIKMLTDEAYLLGEKAERCKNDITSAACLSCELSECPYEG